MVIQAMVSLLVSIGLAFAYGPKLAAATLVFLPLLFVSGVMQGRITQDKMKAQNKELLQAMQVCVNLWNPLLLMSILKLHI